MAATLDKDTLVKHSFWILAGGYVVLVLGCLAVLMTSVSDTVRKEQEDLKKSQDLVKGIANPKNPNVVAAYKKQDDFVDRKKDEVWSKAWETQKDMMTWPTKLQSQFQKYKYFGDPIDQFDRALFDDNYSTQLREVWEVVQPVTANGEGVVQCKGDWGEVLQLDRTFETKPPSKDDIWLTQEELWVKREMLRIIRDANQSVARFKEVTPETSAEKDNKEAKAGAPAEKDAKEAKPETAAAQQDKKAAKPAPAAAKTDPNHKIFRNSYWEFDLTLAGPDRGKYVLRGKITNIGKRKQPLDTKFKVFLQDPRTVDDPSSVLLSLDALPLAVGDSKPVQTQVQEQKAIEGLFGVEQVLNWKTAAVKRLDDLRLMYPSSRTAARTLKPPSFIITNPPESTDSSASGDASSQTAAPASPGLGGVASPYGVAAQMTTTNTLNGLDINRYTDISPQVRHMPVAMVVVVDEEHLPELLAAFVNSKLRIQVLQYHWQHCRDRLNPLMNENQGTPQYIPSSGPRDRVFSPSPARQGSTMVGGKAVPYGANNPLLAGTRGGGERAGPSRGGPGYPPYGRMSPSSGTAGPTRPYGPSGPTMRPSYPGSAGAGSVAETEEEQEDLNLLEVSVYGLASLYERYPQAPAKPAEQGTSEEKKQADKATGGT
jgi:hypothetical protein